MAKRYKGYDETKNPLVALVDYVCEFCEHGAKHRIIWNDNESPFPSQFYEQKLVAAEVRQTAVPGHGPQNTGSFLMPAVALFLTARCSLLCSTPGRIWVRSAPMARTSVSSTPQSLTVWSDCSTCW